MNWLPIQTMAQTSVERTLNALPEGILVGVFVWGLLRVLRRQNSGTRFALWFLALLTVAALPILAAVGEGRAPMAGTSAGKLRPAFTIPGHWALFVFLMWVLGASVAMMKLGAGLWRLHQLRRSCIPIVASDLNPIVRKTLDSIGASGSDGSNSVTIATSECVRVPAAIGFWKRTIVLPAWVLRELPANDLNVILLHEFAHLRRWDDWTNLIQKIVRAIFFFHPAVWWIEKQLSVEREMACDDAVLAETANPQGYATCLVSLLEKSMAHRAQWSMAQAAVDRAREASLRLAQILDRNRPVATRVWKPAVGITSAFALVCLLALPLAPRFVAFDHVATAGNINPADSTARNEISGQPSLRSAAITPAALRTGKSSPVVSLARIVPSRAVLPRRPVPASVIAAKMSVTQDHARLIEASANANQEIAPQFQTLVFFEATEYGTAGGPVWSVQVWQVTLVNAPLGWTVRVPVVSAI